MLALALAAAEWLIVYRERTGRRQRKMEEIGWRDAIAIGLAQVLALVPGSSRSGVTITAGLFAGLNRETAARFSFLLSLPSVFAAGVYELIRERDALLGSAADAASLITATLVSAIVGYATIGFLLKFLKMRTTWVFILYRLALGALLTALLLSGRLQP